MAIVTHADTRHSDGTRDKTIGAAINDFRTAMHLAIDQATQNGNQKLVAVLQKQGGIILEADRKILDAICDLQDKNGGEV